MSEGVQMSNVTQKSQRVDAFGTPIEKNSKKHQSVYKDQVNQGPLETIHYIESCKDLQAQEEKQEVQKKPFFCKCTIW